MTLQSWLHLRLPTWKPSGGGIGRSDISQQPGELFIWSKCSLMTVLANYHLTCTLPYVSTTWWGQHHTSNWHEERFSEQNRNPIKWEMKSSVKWLLPWYVSPVPFCFLQWAAGGFFHTVAIYWCHGFCWLGRKSCRRNEKCILVENLLTSWAILEIWSWCCDLTDENLIF